jgi:hypothetical protein
MALQVISPGGSVVDLSVEELQSYVQIYGPLPNGWTVQEVEKCEHPQ